MFLLLLACLPSGADTASPALLHVEVWWDMNPPQADVLATSDDASLTYWSAEGFQGERELDEEGAATLEVAPGEWSVRAECASSCSGRDDSTWWVGPGEEVDVPLYCLECSD
jgi:hypothetical protein